MSITNKKSSVKFRLSTTKKIRGSVGQLRLKTFNQKNMMVAKNKTSNFVDLEEKKEQNKFKDNAIKDRNEQQEKFMDQTKTSFDPLQMLQQNAFDALQKRAINKARAEFDAIWMFEISGKRFVQILNPLSVGVFESQKCYFVIFYKNEKTAIAMWRGQNQDLLDFSEAVAMFKKTSFRMIKNQTTGRANRAASTIMDVSNFKKKFDM